MKVALDVSAVPPRIAGAGRYIAELAQRLPMRTTETTLVSRCDDAERWSEMSPRATVDPSVPAARVSRLLYEATLLGASKTARRVDVWHAPHYTMPRRCSTPTVVTIHDLTFFTNPEWHERTKVPFFQRAIRHACRRASVIVSVSDYTARLLPEIVALEAPVVVAPLGVELDYFSPIGRGDEGIFGVHQLPLNVPYIFFVGTAEPRKGLDVLLMSFEDVGREDPECELWIAGQAGWGEGLDERIGAHPFGSRIRQLGFVEDELLAALYRRSRVSTYPSRGEGFGLPVLEAMACGANVVTTSDTVMAEVAGDGARLVAIGDPGALSESLLVLLRASEEDRAVLSKKARSRAERFTWDACVDQHLVAYQQAVGAK